MTVSRLRRLPPLQPRRLPDPTSSHETRGSAVLRPIVFGANDGLVSNLALVMGVAGAGASSGVIVVAGIAGLLAGAFSMAVGEYVSVQSQRELLDYQLDFQHLQLREAPEQERRILTDIYIGRGFEPDEARRFVDRIFEQPEQAARLLIFEEVGLDARSIGSPLTAGFSSFLAFTLGAADPTRAVPAPRGEHSLLSEHRREPGRTFRAGPRHQSPHPSVPAPYRAPPAPPRRRRSRCHLRRGDAARRHDLTSDRSTGRAVRRRSRVSRRHEMLPRPCPAM